MPSKRLTPDRSGDRPVPDSVERFHQQIHEELARYTALRLFLTEYRMKRPEILGALVDEVLPASLGDEHPHPKLKGRRPLDFQSSTFKDASTRWRGAFHLPPTREVLGEAKATILLWIGQPATWRDQKDKDLKWW